jgi:hypothetical protein
MDLIPNKKPRRDLNKVEKIALIKMLAEICYLCSKTIKE